MDNSTSFWVYELYCTELKEDWTHEIPGTPAEVKVLRSRVVVDDPSDNICIGGKDNKGCYRQFDSYEAYHVYSYFNNNPEWGLSIESYEVQVPNIEKFKV